MYALKKYMIVMLALATLSVSANNAEASDLVVVDIAQMEAMSIAGKNLRNKIKAKKDTLKAEIEREEKALGKKQKKLMEEKKTLSADDLKVKIIAFDKEFKEKQLKFAKKRKAFEKSVLEAHAKLRSEVVAAVGDISTKEGYKLVLSRQSVVIVEKSVDITAEAMKKLNEKVKSISFK